MNRGTIIAQVKHQEILDEWEEVVRDNWSQPLRPLDAAYIWCYEGHLAPSMLTLIFRAKNNNTHKDTDWFLIDPIKENISRFVDQALMFSHVQPCAGICITLWQRNFWQEIARTPYKFGGK